MTAMTLHGATRSRSHLLRYWRGEVGLAWSFWLVGVVLVALQFAVPVLVSAVTEQGGYRSPEWVLVQILGMALLWLIVMIWWSVGLWRSALRTVRANKAAGRWTLWTLLARFMVVFVLVMSLALHAPTALIGRELIDIVFFDDPALPDYRLAVLPGGRELEIQGGIKYGLAADFAALLADNPGTRVLHLDSGGGRVGEARQVAAIVSAAGLDTFVRADCASACATIFLAGRNRLAETGARIGFHGIRFPGMSVAEEEQARRKWAEELGWANVSPHFIQQALQVPHTEIWYPDAAELQMGNVVTAFVPPGSLAPSRLAAELLERARGQGLDRAEGLLSAYGGQRLASLLLAGGIAAGPSLMSDLQRDIEAGVGLPALLAGLAAELRSIVREYGTRASWASSDRVARLLDGYGQSLAALAANGDDVSCSAFVLSGAGELSESMLQLHIPQLVQLAAGVIEAAANAARPDGAVLSAGSSDWQAFRGQVARAGHPADLIELLERPDLAGDRLCKAYLAAIDGTLAMEGSAGERMRVKLLRALTAM